MQVEGDRRPGIPPERDLRVEPFPGGPVPAAQGGFLVPPFDSDQVLDPLTVPVLVAGRGVLIDVEADVDEDVLGKTPEVEGLGANEEFPGAAVADCDRGDVGRPGVMVSRGIGPAIRGRWQTRLPPGRRRLVRRRRRGAANDRVVTLARVEGVVAVAAEEGVVTVAAEEPVVEVASVEPVVAAADSNDGVVALKGVVAGASVEPVVPAATADHIVAAEPADHVVAGGAYEPVGVRGADNRAGRRCVSGARGCQSHRGDHGEREVSKHRLFPFGRPVTRRV